MQIFCLFQNKSGNEEGKRRVVCFFYTWACALPNTRQSKISWTMTLLSAASVLELVFPLAILFPRESALPSCTPPLHLTRWTGGEISSCILSSTLAVMETLPFFFSTLSHRPCVCVPCLLPSIQSSRVNSVWSTALAPSWWWTVRFMLSQYRFLLSFITAHKSDGCT